MNRWVVLFFFPSHWCMTQTMVTLNLNYVSVVPALIYYSWRYCIRKIIFRGGGGRSMRVHERLFILVHLGNF